MAVLLGVDLGTSSVKVAALNTITKEFFTSSEEYDIDIPKIGYAEQHPDMWWEATKNCIKGVVKKLNEKDRTQIAGIGFSGQMHGLVMLDEQIEPLRSSIIWCDQRSVDQVNFIKQKIGTERFESITFNPLNTGFLLTSLLWLKEHDKHVFRNIKHVMLPKDYIRFKLTNELGSDYSDASASLAFDVKKNTWSKELLADLEIPLEWFPKLGASIEVAGTLQNDVAKELGLISGISISYGGGDQQMQALGNGLVKPNVASATIGTGGQVFTTVTEPIHDAQSRLHTFSSAMPNTWCMMGASLSSGLSLKWLKDKILEADGYDTFNKLAEEVPVGSEGLLFVPYLIGERTPHMDPNARGMFFGLTLKHTRANMVRAVMEGVTFSLKESFELLKENNIEINKVIASGGGARSALWKQIQADIFDADIYTVKVNEQACYGAIIAAGVASNIYKSVEEAVEELVEFNNDVTKPIPEHVKHYQKLFEVYKALYEKNKELFVTLKELDAV